MPKKTLWEEEKMDNFKNYRNFELLNQIYKIGWTFNKTWVKKLDYLTNKLLPTFQVLSLTFGPRFAWYLTTQNRPTGFT